MSPAKIRSLAVESLMGQGFNMDAACAAVDAALAPKVAEAARAAVARAERELAEAAAAARRAEPRTFVLDFRRRMIGWEGDLQYFAGGDGPEARYLIARLAETCDNLTVRVVGCPVPSAVERYRAACVEFGATLDLVD